MNYEILKLLLLGLMGGFLSASLGIGGGIIFVPTLYFILKYEVKTVVGTSLASIAPTAFVAAIAHYIIGTGEFRPLIILL